MSHSWEWFFLHWCKLSKILKTCPNFLRSTKHTSKFAALYNIGHAVGDLYLHIRGQLYTWAEGCCILLELSRAHTPHATDAHSASQLLRTGIQLQMLRVCWRSLPIRTSAHEQKAHGQLSIDVANEAQHNFVEYLWLSRALWQFYGQWS